MVELALVDINGSFLWVPKESLYLRIAPVFNFLLTFRKFKAIYISSLNNLVKANQFQAPLFSNLEATAKSGLNV